MRKAFVLLEAILALMIFSVVILVCSQIFLEVSKDKRVYQQYEFSTNAINNAVLKLSKLLNYGINVRFDNNRLSFYIPKMEIFFSSGVVIPKSCDGNIWYLSAPLPLISHIFSSQGIAKVARQDRQSLTLDSSIECQWLIPLEPIEILYSANQSLLLNQQVLLPNVSKFEFKDEGRFYKVVLCQEVCQTHYIPKGGFYERL